MVEADPRLHDDSPTWKKRSVCGIVLRSKSDCIKNVLCNSITMVLLVYKRNVPVNPRPHRGGG